MSSSTPPRSGFNPRAHVGRDHPPRVCGVVQQVSIHAPTWGATYHTGTPNELPKVFQSTRPRGARLLDFANKDELRRVSIHAPTWGATYQRVTAVSEIFLVSIHAPTWGATSSKNVTGVVYNSFNPRAHVGRDDVEVARVVVGKKVSIHAPTWGATPYWAISLKSSLKISIFAKT